MHLFVSSYVLAVIAINFVRLPNLSKRFLVTCKVIFFELLSKFFTDSDVNLLVHNQRF